MGNKVNHVIHFCGPINPSTVQALRSLALQAIRPPNNATSLTIHFSSDGGDLNSGFTAYHFLRSLPVPVCMHNFGNVESIACLVYLAADERLVVPQGRFLLHGFNWNTTVTSIDHTRLNEYSESLDFDFKRYKAIFDERTKGAKIPIDVGEHLKGNALFIDATTATSAAIATQIAHAEGATLATDIHWWIG